MLTALVLFVSVYLAVRTVVEKLMQNLQSVYAKWEAKSRPRVSGPASHGQQQQHRPRNGVRPIHHRNPAAFNPNKHGVDEIYVPKTRKKVDRIVVPAFKNWTKSSRLRVPKPETLSNFILDNCLKCMPLGQSSDFVDRHNSSVCLENALHIPSNCRSWLTPVEFLKSIHLAFRGTEHDYKPISKDILRSRSIANAISRAVECDPETDKNEHRKRADSILQRMEASVSTVLLRVAVWFMHRIMSRMLAGVYVPKGQIEMLKEASEKDVPIVYLPLHRSHLDYILVTYLLYLNGLRVPLVAAGDNLRIPFFGTLLRGLGGFFIKRRLDYKDGRKDHVYRAVLEEYIKGILKDNNSVEFFLEGGRSRTGKTCLPKAGLLSVIVSSFTEGLIKDAYIVPIAISYEKLLDGNFVREQLGEPKVMETFTAALASIWRILHSNYGAVRVDFCQPFKLKDFLSYTKTAADFSHDCPISLLHAGRLDSPQDEREECSSNSSVSSGDSTVDKRRFMIKSLASHVVHQSSMSVTLMSTNLVALLLLTVHRKGATLQQLGTSLSWLCEMIRERDHHVMCHKDSAETVRHACALLGKELVTTETVQMEWSSGDTENNNLKIFFYRPALHLPAVLELQYYANAVLPVFVCEAIVATSVFSVTGVNFREVQGSKSAVTILRSELINSCLELMSLLQLEFVMVLPCNYAREVVTDTIDIFTRDEILTVFGSGPHLPTRVRRIGPLPDLDWEDVHADGFVKDELYKVSVDGESLGLLEFLRSLLASYVESYWVVACSLLNLVGVSMEESVFFRTIQKVAQDKLQEGELHFEESFAAETFRNAVQLYEQWGIVQHYTKDGLRIFYLSHQWNVDEVVMAVINFVQSFKQ